jgi:hypothetical protein
MRKRFQHAATVGVLDAFALTLAPSWHLPSHQTRVGGCFNTTRTSPPTKCLRGAFYTRSDPFVGATWPCTKALTMCDSSASPPPFEFKRKTIIVAPRHPYKVLSVEDTYTVHTTLSRLVFLFNTVQPFIFSLYFLSSQRPERARTPMQNKTMVITNPTLTQTQTPGSAM